MIIPLILCTLNLNTSARDYVVPQFMTKAIEGLREKVFHVRGIIVRGKLLPRQFADYTLYYKPNIPTADRRKDTTTASALEYSKRWSTR
jgi:hypothetical protein